MPQSQIDSVRCANAADYGEAFFENLARGSDRGQHGIETRPGAPFGDCVAAGAPRPVLMSVD